MNLSKSPATISLVSTRIWTISGKDMLARWIFPNVSVILPSHHIDTHHHLAEEPLLKDSKRRFVLFPIQYPEVRTSVPEIPHSHSPSNFQDMANVQKGRGFFLDC